MLGLADAVRFDTAIVATVAGVEDQPLAEQARTRLDDAHLLAQQLRPPADDATAELAQRAQRGRPADAVRNQAVVALERAKRPLGVPAEYAIGPDQVIAHLQQLLLQ